MKKIILDLCGGTGSWSKPYADAGYDVRVITLPEFDVMTYEPPENIYGIFAAPPCTKFSRAATQILKKDRDFRTGMQTVRACLEIIWKVQERGAQLKFWALENPDGFLAQFLGDPPFQFQPWMFGETDGRATKRTMIWGYFNPPTKIVNERPIFIPLVSPHSRPRKDGRVDHARINKAWAKMSVEQRAATSPYFAKAFYKANQ